MREAAAAADPSDVLRRADLGRAMANLGAALAASGPGGRDEALRQYRKAAAMQERLVAENPAVARYRDDLARSRLHLGICLTRSGPGNAADRAEAARSLRSAAALWERLAHDAPRSRGFRLELAECHVRLGNLHADAGRADAADRARKRGEYARRADDPPPGRRDPFLAFDTACTLAGFAPFAPSAPFAPDGEAAAWADSAMEMLTRAAASGFGDLRALETDPDLSALRGRDDFRALAEGLRNRPARPPPPASP
jgi:hypothetical protein